VTRTLAQAYFDRACTADLAVADSTSDVHALGRLEMHYFRDPATFALLSSPRLTQYITARGVLRSVRGRMRG
jgi:hypothetical protein